MIVFSGTLPKLTQYLSSDNLRGLDDSVDDFLWKIKINAPDLIFVFGSEFSNNREDDSFSFFVGDNFSYLKDKNVWTQTLDKIQSYDVERVICSLKEENIQVSEKDIFLKRFLSFFEETNIVFIEYPVLPTKEEYSELGRLLAKVGEIEDLNVAFLAYGHLSSVLDKTKLFYNGQAEEIDNLFVEHLKNDLFSVFSGSYYQNEQMFSQLQPMVSTAINTRQTLYEGMFIIASALYDKSLSLGTDISKGFELIASPTINGTRYLSCILHKDNIYAPNYEEEYTLDSYLKLLLQSKLVGFNIDESKIILKLPKKYRKEGFFLSLFVEDDNIGCFGNPDIEVNETNVLQILTTFFNGLCSVSRKKIKAQDLLKAQVIITTSEKGFNLFQITNLEDVSKYDILIFKRSDNNEFCYHLKEKTIGNFVKILNDINAKDDLEVFGLK
jgi:hypothetical protein